MITNKNVGVTYTSNGTVIEYSITLNDDSSSFRKPYKGNETLVELFYKSLHENPLNHITGEGVYYLKQTKEGWDIGDLRDGEFSIVENTDLPEIKSQVLNANPDL